MTTTQTILKKETNSKLDTVRAIFDAHKKLSAQESLEPSSSVNAAFTALVSLITSGEGRSTPPEQFSSISKDLRYFSLRGEYLLEKHWAKEIITSTCPSERLLQFPYYHNYEMIVGMEYGAFPETAWKEHTVFFAGSGPLPLTAILFYRRGVRITLVEKDKDAFMVSAHLLKCLGLHEQIAIIHRDIAEIPIAPKSIVMIGAGVGDTEEEKLRIIESVKRRMTQDDYLLLRSTECLATLLYAPVPKEALKGMMKIRHVYPKEGMINSVIVTKK